MDKKLFKILILLILFIPNNVYGVTINDLEEKLRYLESFNSNKLSSSELYNSTYEMSIWYNGSLWVGSIVKWQ